MYDAIIMLLGMLWLLLGIIGLLLDHNKNKSLIERRNLFYVFFYISETIPTRVSNSSFPLITVTQTIGSNGKADVYSISSPFKSWTGHLLY
jgi:hypothetical protein